MHMATVTPFLVLLYPLLSIPMLLPLPLLFIILFPLLLSGFSLYLFLKYNHQTFPFHSQILRGQSIDQSLYVVDSGLLQTARPLSCGGQLFGSKREVGYLLLNILCATFLVPI